MKWNLLTVIVLLVILLYAVKGYRKGFVKTLAAMLCLAVTLVLVYFATPYVRTFLKENTPVYEVVEEQCGKLVGNLGENVAGNKTAQDAYINSLELQEAVKKQLVSNNDQKNYVQLAAENFQEYLTNALTDMVLTILVYVITFLVIQLILMIVVGILNAAAQLPGLHGLNRALGFVLGAGRGLIFVWLVFLVLALFSGTDAGRRLLDMVYENEILQYLYSANIFAKLLFG